MIHVLINVHQVKAWSPTYVWWCSCGSQSGVRWSTKSKARASHQTHVEVHQGDRDVGAG